MTLMERRLEPGYNCCHFLCEAWQEETGESIRWALGSFLDTVAGRTASPDIARNMVRLPAPSGPCVVLWRRRGATPHVGLYIRGTVLHLTDTGPVRQLLDVAGLGYTSARYYAPR